MDKVQGTKHVFWKYFNFAIKVPERKLSKNYDKNYANEFLFCEDKNNFYGVWLSILIRSMDVLSNEWDFLRYRAEWLMGIVKGWLFPMVISKCKEKPRGLWCVKM